MSDYTREAEMALHMVRLRRELEARLEAAEREADIWKDCAAQGCRNAAFYQGIVRRIGKTFGEEARTSDDGSVQDDVLALKVPDLVEALAAHVEQIREAFLPGNDGTDGGRLLAIGYVLNQSPTTSLARLKAEWQAAAISEWAARHLGGHEQELAEIYAAEIRHQAEGGE